MVFESIVVELINRYLGDFVENLDTSQLKIGIWGGDVVLKNLNLKESALDEMDLPVKIKAGHIGNLTLKIPWKNLYTEPVVAEIDGIYALAVPNIGIKYDEEKEKKAEMDAKQKKLEAVEAKKKAEEEKDKPKDPKKDSFVEKLATQVIKNLQIKVTNIHVRYEDRFTNPSSPISIGVTLQELLFQTTDENWKETVIKESVTQIYKLVRLESLAVYWNSKSSLLNDMESPDILTNLKSAVAKEGPATDFQYLFKPISAVAHLRLNTKPDLSEFTIPKIFLTLVFDEIALAMHKTQYDDILEILESMERMNLKSKYKKTRPTVEYKGHAAEWWHHAYAVVLENTVQRRRKMWSWVEIKAHRDRLRQYKDLYVKQLSSKKLGGQDAEKLKSLEQSLDVLNIVMARKLAETEVAKLGAKKKEEKSQGWFGGWFGGGSKSSESTQSVAAQNSLGEEFQKQFDSQEQAKLYKAIGYEEDAVDTTFPVEFVAVRVVTKLNKFSLTLSESHKHEYPLLKTTLTEIYVSLGQRPAANAIRLDAKVDKLRVTGIPQGGVTPKLMNSVKEETASLLTLMFETNPQDGECDSRVKVNSNPVEIIYDAMTINHLAEFFKPPESVRLKQFSEGAMERYKDIQAQTATGMLHAMEEKKYMDIQVNLLPSYIIVPAHGRLSKDVNMLLLNLGNLKVSTEKNKASDCDLKKMSEEQITGMAYDKFKISLENIQLLYVQPGDSWDDPNRSSNSPLYVLRPLSISLDVEKCIFAEDANLPKLRVKGELPLVSVGLSDIKLKGMLELAQSIPLPQSSEAPEVREHVTYVYVYSHVASQFTVCVASAASFILAESAGQCGRFCVIDVIFSRS